MRKIQLIIIILCSMPSFRSALLFPANSVIQLVSSVSVPVINLPPQRVVLFDWGIQMNHVLPFDVVSFYNSPIWPGIATRNSTRRSAREFVPRSAQVLSNLTRFSARNHAFDYKDLTAGELYRGFEEILNRHGYHRTCLLRSICELALHPFDEQETLSDILNFLLSPSFHLGFNAAEQLSRMPYEQAEKLGYNGANCELLYADCERSFLELISKVSYVND